MLESGPESVQVALVAASSWPCYVRLWASVQVALVAARSWTCYISLWASVQVALVAASSWPCYIRLGLSKVALVAASSWPCYIRQYASVHIVNGTFQSTASLDSWTSLRWTAAARKSWDTLHNAGFLVFIAQSNRHRSDIFSDFCNSYGSPMLSVNELQGKL